MMIRKMPKWMAGVALAVVAGAAPLACGGGGGTDNMAGAPNDESGGTSSDASGGTNNNASGGTNTDGSGGTGEAGNTGSGGTAAVDASIVDLITAICEWEFGCCSEGELTFRLGTAGASVEECVEHFTFHYEESNSTANPFPTEPAAARTASGLLGSLGYVVDPNYVDENPSGIGECVAEYAALDCPDDAEPATYCSAPSEPGTSACSLVNLFQPKQAEGDPCTVALKEGDGNDVECLAGTTCVAGGSDDNPETFDACVQRGEAGDPCTQDNDCDYNFYCASNGDCTEKGDEGDDCTFNDNDEPLPDEEDAGCKAGLKCDPDNLICVNNCSENYPCGANAECPEDFVCAPVSIGGDTSVWHQCVPTGTAASDHCDADDDCVADSYCHAVDFVCQGDVAITEDCSKDEMCEEGSFCDLNPLDSVNVVRDPVPTLKCVAYLSANAACFYPSGTDAISSGCNPDAPFCLHDETSARWECATDLRGEGDHCFDMGDALPSECEPGLRCEMTTVGVYTCTAGAQIDDNCDAAHDDENDLDCGPGLVCNEVSEVCDAQLDSGEDCEDPDAAGMAKPSLCKNGSCVATWAENGPDFVCSDAPVPESNGGNDLTCGG